MKELKVIFLMFLLSRMASSQGDEKVPCSIPKHGEGMCVELQDCAYMKKLQKSFPTLPDKMRSLFHNAFFICEDLDLEGKVCCVEEKEKLPKNYCSISIASSSIDGTCNENYMECGIVDEIIKVHSAAKDKKLSSFLLNNMKCPNKDESEYVTCCPNNKKDGEKIRAYLRLDDLYLNSIKSCVDAFRKKGDCVPYKDCPKIYDIITKFKEDQDSVTEEDSKFVKHSVCDKKDGIHYVCCSELTTIPTTTTSPTTTILTTTPTTRTRATTTPTTTTPTTTPTTRTRATTTPTTTTPTTTIPTTTTTTTTPKTTKIMTTIPPKSNNPSVLPEKCGQYSQDLTNKIFEGKETKFGDHPWAVPIFYTSDEHKEPKNLCMGSLIHKRYILTAAHCLFSDKRIDHVRLGDWKLSTDPDCADSTVQNNCKNYEKLTVTKKFMHPQYSKFAKSKPNDIALLRLNRELKFTNKPYAPICLPVGDNYDNLDDGDEIIAIGWGNTDGNGTPSDVLLEASLPYRNIDICETEFKDKRKVEGVSQICVGGGDDRADTCQGDSGGPILRKKHNSKLVQVGITSYGRECGSGKVAVYTKVSAFMGWIEDIISKNK